MIKNIYGIYDVKTGIYGTPMFLLSDGEAIRICTDAVNDTDPKNQLARFSEDFRLDRLGQMDMTTGRINIENPPEHVIDIAQLKTVRK